MKLRRTARRAILPGTRRGTPTRPRSASRASRPRPQPPPGPARPARGAAGEPLAPEPAARARLPRNLNGLLVENVDPDGRAADAGIQAGDVIVEANRKAGDSVDDLRTAARSPADTPPVA